MRNEEEVQELSRAVAVASKALSALSEPVQAAAIPWVLEWLLADERNVPEGRHVVSSAGGDNGQNPTPDLPAIELVAEEGSRTQRALFAIAALRSRGEHCTASAIARFAEQEMARELTSLPRVLKEATPRYVLRRKEGREFVYETTARGRELLASLGG